MLVFSKYKLVFLSVPKTGTTAWQAALAPHTSMIVSDPPELKHAPVFRYNRFFRPALEKFIGEDLHVIAVMREPVAWLGSWFRYRQRPFLEGKPGSTAGMSFDAFVQDYLQGRQPRHANVGSQSKFLEPQRNGTAATHLFRYEDPAALERYLEARMGFAVTTERLNTSRAAPLPLSAQTEEQLRRKYAPDFRLYDSIGADGAYTPEPVASPAR
ncbi:gamma-glutamyl kinase [Pelagivirga sediminicola]|uniref:Gamma-glutamyl kinase n=1 Tax=Pelagivirga sediminicola TaxID=2170575 RepID=A0A2T7GB80_9RHOB|nr:sulfotransferase family 2 domain-containing protein [Pelagivirga sediminicola]PVA11672.1 gamma-glutamyl kinase [Pelagivirga sediminicola]